jgi:hypothetical protein
MNTVCWILNKTPIPSCNGHRGEVLKIQESMNGELWLILQLR